MQVFADFYRTIITKCKRMLRPRIMIGKSCVFVFQFVSFLCSSARSHLDAVLLPHSVFRSENFKNLCNRKCYGWLCSFQI